MTVFFDCDLFTGILCQCGLACVLSRSMLFLLAQILLKVSCNFFLYGNYIRKFGNMEKSQKNNGDTVPKVKLFQSFSVNDLQVERSSIHFYVNIQH